MLLHKVFARLADIWSFDISKRGVRGAYIALKMEVGARLFPSQRPLTICIEPTSKCNLSCVYCWGRYTQLKRQKSYMSLQDFKKIVDEAEPWSYDVVFGLWGEPLLNPSLYEMVSYCTSNGLRTLILTNGTLLKNTSRQKLIEAGLTEILINIGGAQKDAYERIMRGANFEDTMDNIRQLVTERNALGARNPEVKLQMVVTKENVGEVDAFRSLARSLGADHALLKSMFIHPSGSKEYVDNLVENYLVEGEFARHILQSDGSLALKGGCATCSDLRNINICCDGTVIACCEDAVDTNYRFGNAITGNVRAIWRSNKFSKFRANQMRLRRLPICKACGGPVKQLF